MGVSMGVPRGVREMISKLVLVRHGSPDYTQDVADLERPLTDAGLRALQDAMPRKLSLLEPVGKVQVWSSPALRARQTAQVVARCVKVDPGKIVRCDALYTQDRDSFFEQVGREKGTIIAVGHVPFMEEVFRELSGDSLRFGKGSAACFVFRGQDLSSAELCWYVQGPDASRWESLIEMERQLSKAAKRIELGWEELDEHPRDDEALHAFRVSVRKARALVAFCKPYAKHRQSEQVEMALATLQHATSFLRELDTLSLHMDEIAGPGNNLALSALVRQTRDNERTRLMAYLRRRNTQRILREALHGLRRLRWRANVEELGFSQDDVRARFDRMAEDTWNAFATLDLADDDGTHEVRKRMKQVRYVAEALDAILDEDELAVGRQGKELQDALGVLCDARVNLHIIKGLRKRGGLAGAQADFDHFEQGEHEIIVRAAEEVGAQRAALQKGRVAE